MADSGGGGPVSTGGRGPGRSGSSGVADFIARQLESLWKDIPRTPEAWDSFFLFLLTLWATGWVGYLVFREGSQLPYLSSLGLTLATLVGVPLLLSSFPRFLRGLRLGVVIAFLVAWVVSIVLGQRG